MIIIIHATEIPNISHAGKLKSTGMCMSFHVLPCKITLPGLPAAKFQQKSKVYGDRKKNQMYSRRTILMYDYHNTCYKNPKDLTPGKLKSEEIYVCLSTSFHVNSCQGDTLITIPGLAVTQEYSLSCQENIGTSLIILNHIISSHIRGYC